MTDEFDRASALELAEREAAIERARRAAAPLPFTGRCYFCAEPVSEPARFCDADCATDHERERAALRRSGNLYA